MRFLIVGSGGREHAIVRALAESPQDPDIFVAPGNAGMDPEATRVDLSVTDLDELVGWACANRIDCTVVGPERPLVEGLVDRFQAADLPVVGPTERAARLEGSKVFAKQFMGRHGIPTARFRAFDAEECEAAERFVEEIGAPIVVKADGLAGGKGSFVCTTTSEAREALRTIIRDRAFGEAGRRVLVEEFLEGVEASVFALTDGTDYVVPVPSQDHKRIGEGDTGPNTGGMGAYAPAPMATGEVLDRVCERIIDPTLAGMAEEGHPYRGVLYCGLMITEEGPRVVEFNARLGDPEAQVTLPLVESDWAEIFSLLARGRAGEIDLKVSSRSAACVVLASEGYPTSYETGYSITGLEEAEKAGPAVLFFAGVSRGRGDELVTDGGRVLGVTGVGENLPEALDRAYRGAETVEFEGKYYRGDIGREGLAPLRES